MSNLSASFTKKETFKKEFGNLFPAKKFDRSNILNYITGCTILVMEQAMERYADYGLKFINPVFITDKEICPPAHLPGDPVILESIYDYYSLIQSKLILPVSLPVIDNKLGGICLFSNAGDDIHAYKSFRTFNMDELKIKIDPECTNKYTIINDLMNTSIEINKLPETFLDFCTELNITDREDIARLVKTFMLYNNRAETVDCSLVFSTVNGRSAAPAFFDFLFTIISEKPFEEQVLLDFALIIEGISLPLINYYNGQNNDDSKNKNNKRAEILQRELQNSVWKSTWLNGKKIK
jgi:hypothetical protein